MEKIIIINATLNEVRIAITEDGRLAELFIELPDKEKSIGNIYLGKVNRIVQNINAAFIDIGQNQDAFLHFSDIDEKLEDSIPEHFDNTEHKTKKKKKSVSKENTSPDKSLQSKDLSQNFKEYAVFSTKRTGNIKINLEPKQNIIVQVIREAYSSKGVRVTSRIGIPGRYVVLLPNENVIGISKKISSFQEKRRLRKLAKMILPEGYGCIIRTVAEGKSVKELKKDWESLIKIWEEIKEKVSKADKPMLLYQDMPLATSVIRDLFTEEVKHVYIDSKKLYKEITNYLKWASPALLEKVELYSEKIPIFDKFNIEKELELTYKKKVPLPSGGSLVIDYTEAMVVIDVNSGRSVQEKIQEQNALKTNIQASKEIARQLRLRDIGGMILIDFIDMAEESNRIKVYKYLKKEMQRDRAKTVIYPLTQLCICQVTRQRVNQNIGEKMSEECPVCMGSGRVASKAVLLNAIERWLKNFRSNCREFRLILYVNPHIASYLTEGTISRLSKLMIKYFVKIKVQQSEHINIEQFKFYSVKREKDITQDYL